MERLRLLKLLFFIHKCAGILLTSIYISQRVLATPTLNGTLDGDSMNIINISILPEPLTYASHLAGLINCRLMVYFSDVTMFFLLHAVSPFLPIPFPLELQVAYSGDGVHIP